MYRDAPGPPVSFTVASARQYNSILVHTNPRSVCPGQNVSPHPPAPRNVLVLVIACPVHTPCPQLPFCILDGGTKWLGSRAGNSCPSNLMSIKCMASANSSMSNLPSMSTSASFQIFPNIAFGSFDLTISDFAPVTNQQTSKRCQPLH